MSRTIMGATLAVVVGAPWLAAALLASLILWALQGATGAEPPVPVRVVSDPGPSSAWSERIVMLAMAISLLGKTLTDVVVKGWANWRDVDSKTDRGKLLQLRTDYDDMVKAYETRMTRLVDQTSQNHATYLSEIEDIKASFNERLKAKAAGIAFLQEQVDKAVSLVMVKDRVLMAQNETIAKLAASLRSPDGARIDAAREEPPGHPGGGQDEPETETPNEGKPE